MKNNKNANKGKSLEKLVEDANGRYLLDGKALISKIPNNWTVLRKFNALTKKTEIVSAFPTKTIIDFIGIVKGSGIAFDCKECSNKTSFALSNISDHQFEYLQNFHKLGGAAFYLIHFKVHNRMFILPQWQLQNFINGNERKSIPFSYFEQYTKEIKTDQLFLDYLSVLEE